MKDESSDLSFCYLVSVCIIFFLMLVYHRCLIFCDCVEAKEVLERKMDQFNGILVRFNKKAVLEDCLSSVF